MTDEPEELPDEYRLIDQLTADDVTKVDRLANTVRIQFDTFDSEGQPNKITFSVNLRTSVIEFYDHKRGEVF